MDCKDCGAPLMEYEMASGICDDCYAEELEEEYMREDLIWSSFEEEMREDLISCYG